MKTQLSKQYNEFLIELKTERGLVFLYINNEQQDFSEFKKKFNLKYEGTSSINVSFEKPNFSKQWDLKLTINDKEIEQYLITARGTVIDLSTTKKEKGIFIKR